jgi:signal transduction histidine kinase
VAFRVAEQGEHVSRTRTPTVSAVGTVILDAELRLQSFTPGAVQLLDVTAQDVGTALSDPLVGRLGLTLTDEDRVVLGRQLPIRRDVRASDGRPWLVWIRRHLGGKGAPGLVVTVVDVARLSVADLAPRVAPRRSPSAGAPLHRPDEVLEDRLAEREKWLTLVHDITRAVNDAVSWDDGLHRVLELICRAEQWQIGNVYLPDPNAPGQLVTAIGCVAAERFEPFQQASRAIRYSRGSLTLPGRVFASGEIIWVNDHDELLRTLPLRADAAREAGLRAGAALPVTKGLETVAVLEVFSDQPHALSPGLSKVMADVGAQISHVIERERLTSQVAGIAWREQQELIHTLHDAVGQELTSAGLLSASLVHHLREHDPTAAATAQHVADAAQRALQHVRQLSRGLFPVPAGDDGLMIALAQLASRTRSVDQIHCRVASTTPVVLQDHRIATELYRIAQEAVTNAVKHARANEIVIQLNTEAGASVLTVTDDGRGIQDVAAHCAGAGLHIMQYRARAIGASLSVGPRPGGGTVVTCVLRQPPSQQM